MQIWFPVLFSFSYIYIYIYIYILSSTDRPVEFYQNSSVWLDRLDSWSWDRNLVDWNVNPRFYHCGLLHGLLRRVTRIQLWKLQQSLMTISIMQFPQNLWKGSCTKLDFMGVLQSENHIRISLFEISLCFHYFVQSLKKRGKLLMNITMHQN